MPYMLKFYNNWTKKHWNDPGYYHLTLFHVRDCLLSWKVVNPLDSKGNYSATSNNTKLVHWPLTGGLGCYIWYSEEGPGQAMAPPSPLLAVPNVIAHPSTASVPITVFLYDGPLLCGFNVTIKGLSRLSQL